MSFARPLALAVLVLTALVLAAAAPALAQDHAGAWDLRGSYAPTARTTTVTLRVEATAGGLRVTRVARVSNKTITWTSTATSVIGLRLNVSYVLQGGLAGGVPGAQENRLSATYTLSADRARLTERVRNLTRRPPESAWAMITTSGPRAAGTTPTPTANGGVTTCPDAATFDRLARRDDAPGAVGIREVKLLMVDVTTADARLWLMDTKRWSYHHDFYTRGLGRTATLEAFNGQTYFTDARRNVAGTVLFHESYRWPDGRRGLYALEFWPTDPVKVGHVAQVYRALERAMPFAAGRIAYHPAGDTQEALHATERSRYTQERVRVLTTTDLFGALAYQALNLGKGYGVLRVIDPNQPGARPASVRDVVIFRRLPNDLSHTGGIITEAPQTPLSHVNLKAKQNKTPNAFIREASTDPRVAPLLGKVVYYEVGADDFVLREATTAEAEQFLESLRPATGQIPPRDLSVRTIRSLDAIDHSSAGQNGAKAANVAELRRLLGDAVVPGGYAIPFWFYDRHMTANGLYEQARRILAEPAFRADVAARERRLDDLRRLIRRAPVPGDVATAITQLQGRFPAGTSIRCRSSTNNEDLPGFNGAGLYDSYTHRADEGDLSDTVKQVWASLWNFRAFEERDFYRIDHFAAAMGVLVHPNYDDEKSNGVAITRNPFDPNWPGFYVNAQVGESLITNPDGSRPDEFLVSRIGPNDEWETQYVTHSDQVPAGRTVLTPTEVQALVRALDRIQTHFKRVYHAEQDAKFAMDVEWKFDRQGRLAIKQARPVVD